MESAKATTHLDVVQEYVNDLPDGRTLITHVVAVESFHNVGPGGSAVTSSWPQPSVQSQCRR